MRRPRSLYPWYRQRWVDDVALILYGAGMGVLVALVIVGDLLVWHVL
jgi:hypothetical protein